VSVRFQVQTLYLDRTATAELESPPECDGYPVFLHTYAEPDGTAWLVLVWRVTPPPIPTQPPAKRKK
jgi:hypothetical protein